MHIIKHIIFISIIVALAGCSTITNLDTPLTSEYSIPNVNSSNPEAHRAATYILQGNYIDANTLLNQALSSSPRDPVLNLLNGMAYQARATGEGVLWDLAKVGYQLAQKFDPYLWQASYLLGLMQVKERNFTAATASFADAALANPHTALPLYSLAAVSYTQGNLNMAYQAITQALRLDSTTSIIQHYHIAALCLAAAGDFEAATAQVAALQATNNVSTDKIAWLQQKITMWQNLYANPDTIPLLAPAAELSNNTETTTATTARMAILDAVIVRLASIEGQSRGVNLLDGLTAQFTGSIVNSGTKTDTTGLPTTDVTTITDSLSLTIPAVTYTLNIANSNSNTSRMVGHPTVLAFNGKTSKFFVGNQMTVFMGGNYSSASFDKEFGLSLNVTPTFLSDDTVELQVETGFSTLKDGSPAGLIQNSSAILLSKITNDTSAMMRLGQTMAISTGTLYQEDRNQSKVPVLGDIPLTDNLFSRNINSISQGAFLILLTVRAYPDRSTLTESTKFNNIPLRLAQRLIPMESVVQQRLSQLSQRDVLTVIRPQDAMPANPLPVITADTAAHKWQQQFLTELLVGN